MRVYAACFLLVLIFAHLPAKAAFPCTVKIAIAPVHDVYHDNPGAVQKVKLIKYTLKPDAKAGGWKGIVSLGCGLLGLVFPLAFLAIPAIVFGAMGNRPGNRYRKFARIGFVLGIVDIVLFIAAIILFLAVFGHIFS